MRHPDTREGMILIQGNNFSVEVNTEKITVVVVIMDWEICVSRQTMFHNHSVYIMGVKILRLTHHKSMYISNLFFHSLSMSTFTNTESAFVNLNDFGIIYHQPVLDNTKSFWRTIQVEVGVIILG